MISQTGNSFTPEAMALTVGARAIDASGRQEWRHSSMAGDQK
jgi:hypothetical protein